MLENLLHMERCVLQVLKVCGLRYDHLVDRDWFWLEYLDWSCRCPYLGSEASGGEGSVDVTVDRIVNPSCTTDGTLSDFVAC